MDTLITYVTVGESGQPVRSQRRAAGAMLIVGRGTNCQIQLPDARVALDHARISLDKRAATITAAPGHVRVNGRAVESALLGVGDEIEIGPFAIKIDPPPAGVTLAVTVRRKVAASAEVDPLSRLLLPGSQLSMRRLSYLAFGAVLLVFLLLPVALYLLQKDDAQTAAGAMPAQTFGDRLMQSWSPGAVSISHQVFGTHCRACHQQAFVEVRNHACLVCHKDLHQHVARVNLSAAGAAQFQQARCADCHPDHKGQSTTPRAQQLCADCHRDITRAATDASSENVTDFARDHPPFRLSLRDADRPQTVRRVRQDESELTERSNFKFSHKQHLDPRGLRAPGGRKVLECGACHVPNDDGQRMAPIAWERHCQACHALSFDPQRTDRQVPHGSVELVAATLQEFYARMALGAGPDAARADDASRMRPGAVLAYRDRQRVLSIADANARRALDELFGKRQVCTSCHVVERIGEEPGWKVAPVRFTQVWMPHARFSHAAHASTKCTTCHAVTDSETAEDVGMADIERCRECHVGSRPVLGKVTSDCATCHRFHAGGELWSGAAQAQVKPSKP